MSAQVDVVDHDESKEMIIKAMMDNRVSDCIMLIAENKSFV